MMDANNQTDVTATGASETPEPAVGGGSPQRSSSTSQNPVGRVPSMALPAGKTTAETVVSAGTQRTGQVGDNGYVVAVEAEADKNISTMLAAENRELAILMEIKNTLINEEASFKRVKADGVRDAIAKVTNLLNIVLAERPNLRKARRQLVEAVKANGPPKCDTKILTVVTESLARQEAGLAAHSQRLEKMEGILTSHVKMVEPMKTRGPSDDNQEKWTDVVRRRPKNNSSDDQKKPPPQARKKILKVRNPAIIIRTDADAFPALAKKLRGDPSIASGEKIRAMRKTRNGDMLLEVNQEETTIGALKEEISKLVEGEEVTVSALSQRSVVELKDVDSWSDRDEVTQALAAVTGLRLEDIRIISLRRDFGGSQVAIVVLPAEAAHKLVEKGRARIGLVNCRVRPGQTRTRCFKCLAMGHVSKSCTGPDRSTCCRRCGAPGHQAKGCVADQGVAAAFRNVLNQEETTGTHQGETEVVINK